MTTSIGPPAIPSLLCSLELIVLIEGSSCRLFSKRGGHPSSHPSLTGWLCRWCLLKSPVRVRFAFCVWHPGLPPFSEAVSGLGTRDRVMQRGQKRLAVETCRKKWWHYDKSPIAKERGSEKKKQVAVCSAFPLILTLFSFSGQNQSLVFFFLI